MSRSESEKIDYSVPFKVIVVEDCRENPPVKLDGHEGFCLGTYEFQESMDPPIAPLKELHEVLGGNPLIKTDSGYFIWGRECWWVKADNVIPLGALQETLRMQKLLIALELGFDHDLRN